MQHVCGVRGVVVGVGGVVAGLNELQPGAQHSLRAVQELTHTETREDLQPEVSERSAEDRTQAECFCFLLFLLHLVPPTSFIRVCKLIES